MTRFGGADLELFELIGLAPGPGDELVQAPGVEPRVGYPRTPAPGITSRLSGRRRPKNCQPDQGGGFPGRGASPPGCLAEVMQMREVVFPVEVTSGVPVVITPEEVDITNAGALRAALLRAGAQGRKTYVVDMTRTRFCDSAGLHALLGAHRRAQAEGGEVRFVVTGPGVRRVLAIMAIDRVIPVFGRLDEALAPPVGSGRSG